MAELTRRRDRSGAVRLVALWLIATAPGCTLIFQAEGGTEVGVDATDGGGAGPDADRSDAGCFDSEPASPCPRPRFAVLLGPSGGGFAPVVTQFHDECAVDVIPGGCFLEQCHSRLPETDPDAGDLGLWDGSQPLATAMLTGGRYVWGGGSPDFQAGETVELVLAGGSEIDEFVISVEIPLDIGVHSSWPEVITLAEPISHSWTGVAGADVLASLLLLWEESGRSRRVGLACAFSGAGGTGTIETASLSHLGPAASQCQQSSDCSTLAGLVAVEQSSAVRPLSRADLPDDDEVEILLSARGDGELTAVTLDP